MLKILFIYLVFTPLLPYLRWLLRFLLTVKKSSLSSIGYIHVSQYGSGLVCLISARRKESKTSNTHTNTAAYGNIDKVLFDYTECFLNSSLISLLVNVLTLTKGFHPLKTQTQHVTDTH